MSIPSPASYYFYQQRTARATLILNSCVNVNAITRWLRRCLAFLVELQSVGALLLLSVLPSVEFYKSIDSCFFPPLQLLRVITATHTRINHRRYQAFHVGFQSVSNSFSTSVVATITQSKSTRPDIFYPSST